jgi:hypothetical protein
MEEEEGRGAVGQQQLPVDAWLHVFSFLLPRDLLTIGLVCSEWHSLSAHNHVCKPPPPPFKLIINK